MASQAAITTDSRQYNVFTFLEDEVDGDVSDEAQTEVETSTTKNQFQDSKPTLLSRDTDIAAAGDSALACHLPKLSDPKDQDVDNLEFKVDTCQLESSLPTAKRKIVPNMMLDFEAALSPASSLPDLFEFDSQRTPDDTDDEQQDPESHDVMANSNLGPDLDWEDTADATPAEPIPEYPAQDEFEDNKRWRIVQIGSRMYRIDMIVIEQYKKVLLHGGYYGDGLNAIVMFVACYLPDKSTDNYHYIMDNLFLYVMSTLELLVVQEYVIVYFHSATSRHKLPGLRWFRRCYDIIDHRLRKSLRGLLVVHPSLFLKTILLMMKPFVSSKFSAKVHYVNSLAHLTHLLPTEYMFIPGEVIQTDCEFNPPGHVPVHKFVNH